MKTNTPELLKFKRLQRALSESRRGVTGLLELLWLETARQCPDGAIGRFTNEEIAILCDWEGDPDQLVQALLDGPWIDACDVHRLVVHDWEEHCPKYVKGNLASQQKQFAKPVKKKGVALLGQPYSEPLKGTPIAASESEQADPSEPPTTKSSQVKSNQAKSSQDTSTSVDVCCEHGSQPPSASEFVFAVKSGVWWLPLAKLSEYKASYQFEIEPELRKAAQWLRDNPNRRKTSGGMKSFLTSWLNRCHDRRGPPSVNGDDEVLEEYARKNGITK